MRILCIYSVLCSALLCRLLIIPCHSLLYMHITAGLSPHRQSVMRAARSLLVTDQVVEHLAANNDKEGLRRWMNMHALARAHSLPSSLNVDGTFAHLTVRLTPCMTNQSDLTPPGACSKASFRLASINVASCARFRGYHPFFD